MPMGQDFLLIFGYENTTSAVMYLIETTKVSVPVLPITMDRFNMFLFLNMAILDVCFSKSDFTLDRKRNRRKY
jgi:hypothetical protein